MHTIAKRFSFDSAHHLAHLPEGHRCRSPHGHTYFCEVVLASEELNSEFFVLDYTDLKPFKQYIDDNLDHHDLNTVLDFPPCAELIAKHLFEVAHKMYGSIVSAVRVSETPNTWAEYKP